MVRRRFFMLSLAVLAMLGGRPSYATPITFTGNVAMDFSLVPGTDVMRSDNPDVKAGFISKDPTSIGVAQTIINNGWVSGWALQSVAASYDVATDTLKVGLQTFKNSAGQQAIFGDSDGNGNPGTMGAGIAGTDSPNFGGTKSFAVSFAPTSSTNPKVAGTPTLIAGIPYDKTQAGTGIDGFTVSQFKNVNGGLNSKFGASYGSGAGSLAFNPSAAQPEAEFTINGFSHLSGIDLTKPLFLQIYAGSGDDTSIGELSFSLNLPALAPQVPEPATWLAWSAVVAGGAVLRYRRKRIVS